VLLPLINSDFGNLSEAIVKGKLADFPLNISDTATLGVVIAAPGYPGIYPKNVIVKDMPDFPSKEVLVFHASTYIDKDGMLRTGGGRCFTVVGRGKDLLQARARAYSAVKQVYFDGAWYRSDIGGKIFD
jgi:phosphoribosylamine--glycine ligase